MGFADAIQGIQEKPAALIAKLRPKFNRSGADPYNGLPASGVASEAEVSQWLSAAKVHLNSHEIQNLFLNFSVDEEKKLLDVQKVMEHMSSDPTGTQPIWYSSLGESVNDAHLALSGISTMDFGVQSKPFPEHWGKPPNAQMKGHSGVVRDLPGGYGKGNAPMEKYVREHMIADKRSFTDEMGRKPYPFGNYSLGCNPGE